MVTLTVKTIKNELFTFEIDPSKTVGDLKDITEAEKSLDKATQVIIFDGNILPNDRTIDSIGIGDNHYLVLVTKKVRKKKAVAEKETPPQPAEKSAETSPDKPAEAPAEAPESKEDNSEPQDGDKMEDAEPSQADEPEPTPAEENPMVDTLVAMGFERSQSVLALQIAGSDPNRAVELLTSGLPLEQLAPPQNAPSSPSPAQTAGSGGTSAGVFEELRNMPEFQQLRAIARQNPNALEAILQQLAASQPDLMQVIAQNQDEFIRLLTEGGDGPAPAGGLGGQGGDADQNVLMPYGPGGPIIRPGPTPGTVQIQVAPADMEAINNLVAIGFNKQRAMEAYFAFGKDISAAADYLASNPEGLGDLGMGLFGGPGGDSDGGPPDGGASGSVGGGDQDIEDDGPTDF